MATENVLFLNFILFIGVMSVIFQWGPLCIEILLWDKSAQTFKMLHIWDSQRIQQVIIVLRHLIHSQVEECLNWCESGQVWAGISLPDLYQH